MPDSFPGPLFKNDPVPLLSCGLLLIDDKSFVRSLSFKAKIPQTLFPAVENKDIYNEPAFEEI